MEKEKSLMEYFESIYEISPSEKREEIHQIKEKIKRAQKEGFEIMELSVRNGCGPYYGVKDIKDEVLYKLDKFLYDTTRNGECHLHRHFILMKDSGIQDRHGRNIYQVFNESETPFVCVFSAGSPERFQDLEILPPDL